MNSSGALAQLEFFHSRTIAPTRRVALGDSDLPWNPAPGLGGMLLGAVVASNMANIEDDLDQVEELAHRLEFGFHVSQPRLRHRLQADRVGLLRHRSRLVRGATGIELDVEDAGSSPTQRVLAALYSAGAEPDPVRAVLFRTIRRGMRWKGPIGPALFVALSGSGGGSLLSFTLDDPVSWALHRLGFGVSGLGDLLGESLPMRSQVQRQFRTRLREVHPDHGGGSTDAAESIAELREARRILLG